MSKSALTFIVLVILIFSGLFLFINYTKQQAPTPEIKTTDTRVSLTPIQQEDSALAKTASQTPTLTPSTTVTQTVTAKKAVIKTSKGDISISFYGKDAPNTVANFVTKAQSGYYNNLTFHRVEDWVLQGGDPKGNGTGGGSMPTELNSKPFVVGAVGVARGGDVKISNDSQFFITKTEAPWLNGQYTNFGIVTEGMNIVNTMAIGDKILGITVE